jgi:hypothetical protein
LTDNPTLKFDKIKCSVLRAANSKEINRGYMRKMRNGGVCEQATRNL